MLSQKTEIPGAIPLSLLVSVVALIFSTLALAEILALMPILIGAAIFFAIMAIWSAAMHSESDSSRLPIACIAALGLVIATLGLFGILTIALHIIIGLTSLIIVADLVGLLFLDAPKESHIQGGASKVLEEEASVSKLEEYNDALLEHHTGLVFFGKQNKSNKSPEATEEREELTPTHS